jgi:TonB-dependent receptor
MLAEMPAANSAPFAQDCSFLARGEWREAPPDLRRPAHAAASEDRTGIVTASRRAARVCAAEKRLAVRRPASVLWRPPVGGALRRQQPQQLRPSPQLDRAERPSAAAAHGTSVGLATMNNLPLPAGLLDRGIGLVVICGLLTVSSLAQGRATATLEGRVLNTRNGEYLENARVTIEGTSLEAFTDATGQFRITNVPAGAVKVRVFFTGLDVQVATVLTSAGATVQRDFALETLPRGAGAREGVVKLDDFVVAVSREMDGAAIAINEQRFATNIRNVVAADEFGQVTDGNVGEFLKFLPGMSINSVGGEARTFMLNGVPPNNVPIAIGGFDLASAAGSSTSRRVEVDQVSLNNISRIEVLHSPTPESPGMALAGSVNMVPRSAFDRQRPVVNGSVYLLMRDNARDFHETPGPLQGKMRKVFPGLDFSWIVPVNERFGFTVSGGTSTLYTPLENIQNTWRGNTAATSAPGAGGAPGAFPDTTPDRPYLSEFQLRTGGKVSKRSSAGLTVDYKLARNDRVSIGFQYAYSDKPFAYRYLTFSPTRVLPDEFGPTFTHGVPGAGEIRLDNQYRQKAGATYMPTFVWRHPGPVWKAEAGAGYSHATNIYSDMDKGYFSQSRSRRTAVTVSFDDNFYLRPRRITVTDAAGNPVDPYDINSYVLATSNGDMLNTTDVRRSAYANVQRDFDLRGIPLTLKGGLDVRNSMRDNRAYSPSFTFRGADGRPTTTPLDPAGSDDRAAVVFDPVVSQGSTGFGFPPFNRISNYAYFNLYRANPEYFNPDQNGEYRSIVSNSKRAEETISSGYLRADVAFLQRRLRLVGGVRAEQTNVAAEGPLTDQTRNFQRDASGRVIDSNPTQPGVQPALIIPTSNALGVSRLTFIDRAGHAKKEYLRWFPSLNASFNVRENLVARAAYYTSVGRPDYNQYAGGLTLPDVENSPSANNRISVNNVAIKAWRARTAKVRIEYYFERVGQVSIGAFRRDFRNFFGSTVFNATPEFLALYGLDPAVYDAYDVSTQHNITSTVRMTGLEFDYKQALTLLPRWARGVQVFANASALRATGDATSNFSGFVPRVYNWGVSLTRERFHLRANWNYRGLSRAGSVTGRSIEPGTFSYMSKVLNLEISGEYWLRKRIAAFVTSRNLLAAPDDTKIYGPTTPLGARFRERNEIAAMWTVGLKGNF